MPSNSPLLHAHSHSHSILFYSIPFYSLFQPVFFLSKPKAQSPKPSSSYYCSFFSTCPIVLTSCCLSLYQIDACMSIQNTDFRSSTTLLQILINQIQLYSYTATSSDQGSIIAKHSHHLTSCIIHIPFSTHNMVTIIKVSYCNITNLQSRPPIICNSGYNQDHLFNLTVLKMATNCTIKPTTISLYLIIFHYIVLLL